MTINVRYGANDWNNINIEDDETVESFIDSMGITFGFPEDATYLINGETSSSESPLHDGDSFEVQKHSGTKG